MASVSPSRCERWRLPERLPILTFAGLIALLAACGGPSYGTDRDLAFGAAVESNLDEAYEDALSAAHFYLKTASPDDEKYDRAELLFATAAEKLGLRYVASLYYLDVARSRRDVEQIDEGFAGLERIIRTGPYDEQTIVHGFLATADITGLREDLKAFVDYYQGLDSSREGLDEWANEQFARIPKTSPYYARAWLVKGVRLLARGRFDEGRKSLEGLLESKGAPAEVKNEARLALARLALEERKFDDAIPYYEEVKHLAPERPSLLLEMAWAHFYRGDSRRALGLLVALDAPTYGSLIAPERYLLEAFCLRRLCQFEPARIAAARLQQQHDAALEDLHAGILPMNSEPIRAAARRRGIGKDAADFVRSLRREKAMVEDDLDLSDDLETELTKLYESAIARAEVLEAEKLRIETDQLAEELIAAEDGVRLILHELSVQLLRGRRRPPGAAPIESLDIAVVGSGRVSYSFMGEFWTDELDDLVVVVPDRCLE